MRPAWMNVGFVAALILLLGVVPLPQIVFAGNSTVITEQQWEQQQLILERFDKLLQRAQAQSELMRAWHKKARLQQAKQKGESVSKRGTGQVAVAVSR
jgi:hypothetical protein